MTNKHRDTDFAIHALEAQRSYAERFALETRDLKPCIAVLLDGNLGGAARHNAAFCIAIELRRMGLPLDAARSVISWWARSLNYRLSQAERSLKSAYSQTTNGAYRYRPPGVRKTTVVYRTTLLPICETIGCPSSCTPLAGIHRAAGVASYSEFCRLGWLAFLHRKRQRCATDVYRALCELEKQRGYPDGAPMFTSYEQLAAIAEIHKGTVGRGLRVLAGCELIGFEAGSGSGPRARDRKGSRVHRLLPIKPPPPPTEAQ